MDKLEFPLLGKEDIDARIATFKDGKGAQLLLYKDARCDMAMLDAVVGSENWQRKHYECKGNLFCSVGILWGHDEWVWKDDCGSESNVEKEKGEASDSFKRACSNWGIGRELYTAPFIWVPADKMKDKYDKFSVEKIAYRNREISELAIYDITTNKRVYSWSGGEKEPADKPVVCPECNGSVKPIKKKDGTIIPPEKVVEAWGCCAECHNKKKSAGDVA